ncbi:MAG: SpoIIE family protein phosphatase [Dehalobacterium sp.]
MSTILDWSVAVQKLAGETESGDLYLVKPFPDSTLVAVIDGLGHGTEAAKAARIGASILEACPQESITFLMEQCHKYLKQTRGAAMSLASFNMLNGTMTWLGVGNVEGILFRNGAGTKPHYKSLLLSAGIVGCHLPQLHVTVTPVTRGDTLILTTDGINYNFAQEVNLNEQPQQIADRILAHHAKVNDDALVLVARYRGGTL